MKPGAAKSAANPNPTTLDAPGDGPPADSFAEALALLERLPLTDAERAEAVRRMLANHEG